MSSIVSWIVILGTVGSLIAFFLILQMNKSVSRPGKTTGHSYDGIEEYDNPLPAWWYWWFLLTIAFAVGYLAWYPGLGNFEGLGGWSQHEQLRTEQQLAEERYGPIFAQYAETPIDELAMDPDVKKMGRRLFTTNCSVCHGATGQGSFGFPDLTDDEWLWGSTNEQIEATILGGRNAAMPPFAAALGDDGVGEVASFVLKLAGRDVDEAAAAKGATKFQTYCAVCHNADGTGNPMFGAPNLANETWLYGNSRARIEHVIKNGRNGVMPPFKARLGEDKVHILSAYVKSLGKNP